MTRRRSLFLDTGLLLATVLKNDPDHKAAVGLLHRLGQGEWSAVHTSDYVLAEALNFVRMKVKRRAVADALTRFVFGDDGAAPVITSVVRIHSGRFARALHHYQADFDRGLSLTDWSTIVAMQESTIDDLATFDKGFHGLVDVVRLG